MSEQPKAKPRRTYRLRRRLEHVAETRERITAAAFDLHATIGPSRTTISAIAERAGVQRHTVYHHFPDIDSLYDACTRHGMRTSGIPEPAPWLDIADPVERLRFGLGEMYAYYRNNERMLANVLGGIDPTAPPPTGPDPFDQRMADLFDALLDGWTTAARSRPTLEAVIAHALGFETWRSLSAAGLTDDRACRLMVDIVAGVAKGELGD
ncbi:MAG: TetR/AcrR family transcriptional regulator [Ilumatobacteraceae bacterium]